MTIKTGLGYNDYPKGIELSNNVRYVYYTTRQFPHIFYVDLNDPSLTPIGLNLANAEKYQYSQIEVGIDGRLYFAGENRMGYLEDSNDPNSNWVEIFQGADIDFSLGIGNPSRDEQVLLPSQVHDVQLINEFNTGNTCCHQEIKYTIDQNEYKPNGNVTWNNTTIKLRGNLVIKSGVTITLNNTRLEVADNEYNFRKSKIIIERGGKLVVVNGSEITSVTGCENAMWEGIEIHGNPTQSFNDETKQGSLLIVNSTISNALIGVSTVKKEFYTDYSSCQLEEVSQNDDNYSGGIIKATLATFINNRNDVDLYFTADRNASFFYGCRFFTDGFLNKPFLSHRAHVKIHARKAVSDITFLGCEFENKTPQMFDYDKRRTGIESTEIGVYVYSGTVPATPYSSTVYSEALFQNLTTGIRIGNVANQVLFGVEDTKFNNNSQYGIVLDGSGIIGGVRFSTFDIPLSTSFLSGSQSIPSFGIYLNQTNGIIIRDNVFSSSNSSFFNRLKYGVYANNTGDVIASAIYRNEFHDLDIANQFAHDNSFLDLNCNVYANGHRFDWLLSSGKLMDQGKCPDDFTANLPRSNIFTQPCTGTKNIRIAPGAQNFTYSSYPQAIFEPVCSSWNLNSVSCRAYLNQGYNYTEACPIKYELLDQPIQGLIMGGTIPDKEQLVGVIRNDIAQLAVQLDGGDTRALVDFVKKSTGGGGNVMGGTTGGMPESVKAKLIEKAPRVTHEVLYHALNRQQPLSNKDLEEIMLANSPLPRGVMELLENKQPALPQTMLNNIRAAQNGVSEADEIMDEIAQLEYQKHELLLELTYYYMLKNQPDSAIQLIEEPTNHKISRFLLPLLLNNDTERMTTHLSFLEQETLRYRGYNDKLADELQQYASYYAMMKTIHDEQRNSSSLTEQEYLHVQQLSTENTKAGTLARNLMYELMQEPIWREVQEVEEDVDDDMGSFKVAHQQTQETKNSDVADNANEAIRIAAYPNPFSDVLTFDIYLPQQYTAAVLQVVDVTGKKVSEQPVQAGHSTIAIDPVVLQKGVYFYHLFSDGMIIETNRIIKL
jgi:hypothetical protein